MKQFTSLDMQQRSGDIQRSAAVEPVVITNHGRPRLLVLSVDEFTRLKTAAGEAVPSGVIDRKPVMQRGLPPDPLGRSTDDFERFVLEVADHALSGRDRDAIGEEIRSAERRLGIRHGGNRA